MIIGICVAAYLFVGAFFAGLLLDPGDKPFAMMLVWPAIIPISLGVWVKKVLESRNGKA